MIRGKNGKEADIVLAPMAFARQRGEVAEPWVEDEPVPGDSGGLQHCEPCAEEPADAVHDHLRVGDHPGSGAGSLHRVHHDQLARRAGQRGVHSGIWESLDVVQVRGAAREREALSCGLEGIHRQWHAVRQELVQDRGEPLLFLGGGDGLGVRVAGRRAEFDDVGAFGVQPPGVSDRVSRAR